LPVSNIRILIFYRLSGRERQQGNVAGPLDCRCQAALVGRAYPGQTARHNLATLSHKLLQQPHIFVVDVVDLLDAEPANLLTPEKLASLIAASAVSTISSIATIAPVTASRLRASGFSWSFLIDFVSHNSP
jgi:hypothetical protein